MIDLLFVLYIAIKSFMLVPSSVMRLIFPFISKNSDSNFSNRLAVSQAISVLESRVKNLGSALAVFLDDLQGLMVPDWGRGV